MAKVEVKVEVSKEAYEVAIGLGQMVAAIKTALADGWQAGTDVPVIVSAAITNLVPAVDGLDKVGAELKEDPEAFVKAVSIGLAEAVGAFLKK